MPTSTNTITFYPLGNADCCLIKLHTGALIAFDYADMNNPDDDGEKRTVTMTMYEASQTRSGLITQKSTRVMTG